MPRVFISYRRSDSAGHAGRLRDECVKRFGKHNVFFDLHSIPPGSRFQSTIDGAIAASDAVLVVVGPAWLTVTDAVGRRRLDDPGDPVRTEVASAIRHGGRKIIPVLVGGARAIPSGVLPAAIEALASYQQIELTDGRWSFDVRRLLRSLGWSRRQLAAVALGLGSVAIAAVAYAIMPKPIAVEPGSYECTAAGHALPDCNVTQAESGARVLSFMGPRHGESGLVDRYSGTLSSTSARITVEVINEFQEGAGVPMAAYRSILELSPRREASGYAGTWKGQDGETVPFTMSKTAR